MSQNIYEYIKKECIRYGDFTFPSGARSDKYFDLRKLMLDHSVADSKLHSFWYFYTDVLAGKKYSSIGGLEAGAAIFVVLLTRYLQKKGFYVRKSANGHVLQNIIEGWFVPPCIIVDDVTSTGKSIQEVENLVGSRNVVARLCIIDGRPKNDREKYKIFSLYREEDF